MRTRSLEHTGTYHTVSRMLAMIVSADGTRALVNENEDLGGGGGFVIDARTAQKLAAIPTASMVRTTLLADNSIATISLTPSNEGWLNVYAPDGTPRYRMALGSAQNFYLSRELTGGRLTAVASNWKPGTPITAMGAATTYVIDYVNGRVVQRAEGLGAVVRGWQQWYSADPRHDVSDAERPLAAYGKDALYSWQPLTGEKKLLLASR